MIINGKEYVIDYVLTADDEEPKCGRCDHICDDQEFCDKCCGSEH